MTVTISDNLLPKYGQIINSLHKSTHMLYYKLWFLLYSNTNSDNTQQSNNQILKAEKFELSFWPQIEYSNSVNMFYFYLDKFKIESCALYLLNTYTTPVQPTPVYRLLKHSS